MRQKPELGQRVMANAVMHDMAVLRARLARYVYPLFLEMERRDPLDELLWDLCAAYVGSQSGQRAAAAALNDHLAAESGVEPISGRPYAGPDDGARLYLYVTTWHSLLISYESLHGRRPAADRDVHFAAGLPLAEMLGLDGRQVPSNSAAVHDYFADLEVGLVTTIAGRHALGPHLRAPEALTGSATQRRLARAGAVAITPRIVRSLLDLDRTRTADWATLHGTRALGPLAAARLGRKRALSSG
jgi:uncharacterized protein (DUF2236 family)